MNRNQIQQKGFSNPDSEKLYKELWPDEPITRWLYEEGRQCCFCVHYGKFNMDWGLCQKNGGRHHLETVFEHFTCSSHEAAISSGDED